MLKQHPMRSVLLLPATLLVGCLGYRTPLLEPNEAKPSGSPPRKDAATDLAPKDGRPDLASDTQGNDARSSCPAGTPYILVLGLTLGVEENLYRFDPSSLALARLGPVSCPATTLNGDSSLNSMTVSPIGPAYLSNHAGNLCLVDLTTLRVRSTLFDPASTSYNAFGMALIPDKSPAGQSLYISVQSPLNRLTGLPGGPDTLERVDLGTYAAKVIGTVRPVGDYEQDLPSAELTAGPNGELYGFAVGPASSKLLTIDPTTATAFDVINVDKGFNEASFALVNWQGTFYLFVGDANPASPTFGGCEVYRYVKGDPQVADIGPLGVAIIGAGVATCQ